MKATKNIDIQKMIDGFIDKIFLRFISDSVRPNQVTAIRFLLVPVVYLLLVNHMLILGLIVFAIAAITDAIDGAMARTRNQITDLGKVIDPIADKLLVLTVLFYIGWRFLLIKVFILYILLEMLAVLVGYLATPLLGRTIGANFFGKIKLNLECISIGFFIIGMVISNRVMINIAKYILFIALFFAVVAGIETLRRRAKIFLKERNINVIYE
ncbi:MAG TPA: CDP-alcohol phosphatidyltransferase family protein [Candidatus Saccharimonadales bacterium]|nr:CDP-alcohol phosphatidyltransferase family protein [Candidatus Saccharimonadales bacterium]